MVLGGNIVGRLLHGRPGKRWRLVRLPHARLGIHALDWDDAPKGRVVGRLREIGLAWLWARVVGDQVKVRPIRCRDAERLLHQTIGLIPVALRLAIVVVLITSPARLPILVGSPPGGAEATASLALHLPVRQKTPRNPASTP